MPISIALNHADVKHIGRPQRELAGSKSLGSMLPTILTTGVITLVICAVMRLVWVGFSNDFFAAWMEAWLTTWPIAFPVAYMSKPLINRLTHILATPVTPVMPAAGSVGLSVARIEEASTRASEKNQLHVQRRTYPQSYY